ncbi:MAG TPA: rod shape-determining protein MreD [Prevotella sp.]|nr:rod shape-determining protein MreD [Prevotella sp.]
MNIETVKSIGTFVILLLAQALVLNHIHLFNCATPFLYVYMVLHFQRNAPKWSLLLWSFLMGLLVDVFSNTPGVAAGSMAFIGFIQPYLLELFAPRDSADDLVPSRKTFGGRSFFYYSLTIVFIYCLIFFTLETFNFFNWLQWIFSILGSMVLSLALIYAIENLRKN